MLAIILSILKILGILIGIIIITIISLLLLMIFIPIRYDIDTMYKNKHLEGNISVSWFLKALYIGVLVDNLLTDFDIRIFGIKIFNEKDKTKKVEKKIEEDIVKPTVEKYTDEAKDYLEKNKIKKTKDTSLKKQKETKENNINKKDRPKKLYKRKKIDKKVTSSHSGILGKARHKFLNKKKLKKNTDKNKEGILSRISELKIFFSEKNNKKALKKIWRLTKKLQKKIKPKKYAIYIKIGMYNPATTGQILGGLSFLYVIFGHNIIIEGDFDKARYEGNVKAVGKIRIGTIIVIGIQLLLDKNIRKIVKEKLVRN